MLERSNTYVAKGTVGTLLEQCWNTVRTLLERTVRTLLEYCEGGLSSFHRIQTEQLDPRHRTHHMKYPGLSRVIQG